MKNSLIKIFGHITQLMWQRGWNEFSGGNITVRMTTEEVSAFDLQAGKKTALDFDAKVIAGEYFICKGTGKFFRHIEKFPEETLAIIQIAKNGKSYTQYWGQAEPTSEISAHLLSHTVRKVLSGGKERVIMHCHLTHMIALSFVIPTTDTDFSRHLWMTMPECAVLFPEGVGVVPYLTPGTVEIGAATGEKMRDYRIVMWTHHGTFVSHTDLENGFGLLEAVEKSAEIVLKILSVDGHVTPMEPEEIRLLGKRFGIELNSRLLEGE